MSKDPVSPITAASPSAVRAARLAADQARRRDRFARRFEAMQDAMKRYDKGATVTELWPQWKERTGMTRATLVKVVEGTYDTRVARALYVILNRPSPGLPPKSTAPDAERIHRLTPEILLAIRAAARTGMPWGQIAHEFRAHPNIVRLTINGTYQTRSMKKALTMEAEAGAGQSPSSTEPSANSVKCHTDTTAEIPELLPTQR